MSFEDDLFKQLSGYAGLTALVGSKIYPNHIPQTTIAPYLMYFEVYREKNYVFTGYNGTSVFSIQISAYAPTQNQVRLIADQISMAMAAWPVKNNQVGFAIQDNEVSAWREDLKLYEIDMDFDIFYTD